MINYHQHHCNRCGSLCNDKNLWWKDKNDEIVNDPSSSVTEFSLEDETEQGSSKVIDDKSNEVMRNSKRSFRQDSYEVTIHGHRRSNEVTFDSAVSTPLSVSASPMMKRNCWIDMKTCSLFRYIKIANIFTGG